MPSCKHCGKIVEGRKGKIFCDRSCANKFNNAERSKNYIPLTRKEKTVRQYGYHEVWKQKHGESHVRAIEYTQFSNFYQTTKGRATHMLNNARKRSKVNGIECSLTQDWIKEKLDNGICEVTGIPFVLQMNGGKGHKTNSFSPSLDRIIQDGPYTPENVRVACWIYNRARGAFPPEDFDTMINALKDTTGFVRN